MTVLRRSARISLMYSANDFWIIPLNLSMTACVFAPLYIFLLISTFTNWSEGD